MFPLKWTDIDAGAIFKLSKTISPFYNTIFFLKSYTPCILYLFVTHSFYPQERNTGEKGKNYCWLGLLKILMYQNLLSAHSKEILNFWHT